MKILLIIVALLFFFFFVGCSSSSPTVTTILGQTSPTHTELVIPPSATRAVSTPTQSITPPTATVVQPTFTATLMPEPDPTQGLLSIEDVVASLEGLPIDTFFEESYRQLLLRDPDHLFVTGLAASYGVANDHFSDQSIEYLQETARLEVAILDLLRSYDRNTLTSEQQLSYDIYLWVLEDRLRGHEFMFHNFPVNSLTIWGKQNWLVDFMINYQPINSVQDAETYLARFSQIDTWTEQLIEGLELRAQMGILPPKYILDESIQQIENQIGMQSDGTCIPEATILFSSFHSKLAQLKGVDADQKQALSDAARVEIQATFIPAFLELRETLEYLATIARDEGGAWTLPNGDAYYTYALWHETSTQMTPDQIHQLGLAELARIQEEIRAVAAELSIPPDELEQRLAEDSPLMDGNALLRELERLITMADQASSASFGLYPAAGVVVQPEPFGSLAYYLPPPFDGSGPGQFFVNLDRPTPKYLLPAMTFHETIPGHHLQGALTRELGIPTFRKDIEFNAYVEGWALYAEHLAWEMGLYDEDPLSNLGRLQFEQMRSLRLIVDTGVHAKGWTLAEASARVDDLTGASINQGYLTRFYVLPGQASSYTIGYLKFLELRQRAVDQLGDVFDLSAFHDVVLGNGPMPLEILEQLVDAWIENQLD